MDDFENQLTEGTGSAWGRDSYGQKVEGAVGQTIARALRDATQTADPARQQEAAAWLWICCPDIAEQVELPDLHFEAMTGMATAYIG